MKQLMADEFNELRKKVEKETGFACFEPNKTEQPVFYGTSTYFDDFSALVKDYIPTGTMAYLIDTKSSKLWSDFESKWY